MKILITGGTGFIGRHLAAFWKRSGHTITALARHVDASLFDSTVGCLEADITEEADVQATIIFLQPDVVIHTAAMSKPNDCEQNKELCYRTNVTATEYLVTACNSIGAKLIFLSTDFVFGHNGPYSEADDYEPVNYYGESKMLAEKAIEQLGISYAIVRTGLVIGEKRKGQANTFLHWVKDNLEAGKTSKLYTDQQRSPTYVADLCSGIDAVIQTNFTGTIHLSGEKIYTPYSLAQQVAEFFCLNKNLLQPITRHQQPELAMRPENAVLKIDKAKAVLNYKSTSLQKALQEIFAGVNG